MSNVVMSFRKMVMPTDLNAANCLFGGQMMKWLDEAAAIYATCQLKTKRLVTKRVSDLTFDSPAYQGDIVEFFCYAEKIGRTSFTVKVRARTKVCERGAQWDIEEPRDIVTASIVFVSVNEDGRPTPHMLKHID